MDIRKNYYQTLGVLPDANIVVIKASFRALSKLYHPDVYKAQDAGQRMADLNEAHQILSDPVLRARYDGARRSSGEDTKYSEESGFSADTNFPSSFQPDWEVALKYYPSLNQIVSRLRRFSSGMAFTYKSYLLETKEFEDRVEVAQQMELRFLQLYFGKDPVITEFATDMVLEGRKDVLRELNRIVRVLGDTQQPERLVERLRADFKLKKKRAGSSGAALSFTWFLLLLGLGLLLMKLLGGGTPDLPKVPDVNLLGVELPKVDLDLGAVYIPGLPAGMKDKVGGMFGQLGSTLNDVTDAESANDAKEDLTDLSGKLSEFTGGLTAENKGPVGKMVGMFLPQIEFQINKVKAIPGVGAILGGVLDKVLATLKSVG